MLTSTELHRDFAPLRIATHEIGVTGLSFAHELDAEALTALLHEPNHPEFSWRATTTAGVKFLLERENDHSFLVTVTADISLSCPCVRCLEVMILACPLNFTIRMLEMEHLGLDAEAVLGLKSDTFEIDLSSDDNQALIGYFSAKTIDLGLIVRDQIFIEVPDYPHCDMGKDALQASRCKVLSPAKVDAEKLHDNPFVKRFGKTK